MTTYIPAILVFSAVVLIVIYIIHDWQPYVQRLRSTRQARHRQVDESVAHYPAAGIRCIHLSDIPDPTASTFVQWQAWLDQPTTTLFALYDDNPVDDEELCTVLKHGTNWSVQFRGYKQIYTRPVGTSADMTTATLLAKVREVRNEVLQSEGSLRRQV